MAETNKSIVVFVDQVNNDISNEINNYIQKTFNWCCQGTRSISPVNVIDKFDGTVYVSKTSLKYKFDINYSSMDIDSNDRFEDVKDYLSNKFCENNINYLMTNGYQEYWKLMQ